MPLKERIEQEYGRLHSRQKAAVDAILDTYFGDDFFVMPIVDGPPGTGKTHTGTVAAG